MCLLAHILNIYIYIYVCVYICIHTIVDMYSVYVYVLSVRELRGYRLRSKRSNV